MAGAGWMALKSSSIHGVGAFARIDISTRTRVVEYIGERVTKSESLRRCELDNRFIFALDADHDLDGDVEWNPARFINHSCAPNCEAVLERGRIWIIARRGIRGGEEITFNYGYDLEDYRGHPCHCGARGCIGFIVAEELFQDVRMSSNNATDCGKMG